jgi:Protein of unknown function (DUF2442)
LTRASIETKRRAKARRFRLTIRGGALQSCYHLGNGSALPLPLAGEGRGGGSLSRLDDIEVTKLKYLGGHRLHVTFSNGTADEHDFSALVAESGPMGEPLRDPAYFALVFLEDGGPTWPNGFDMDPEWLRREIEAAGVLVRITAA